MRLIDADALLDEAQSGGWDADINELRMMLKYVPTIDAAVIKQAYDELCSNCGPREDEDNGT